MVKKYNVSVFTVCEQLRKDDWSAEPREGTHETEGREKARLNLRKESEGLWLELRLLDLEAHSQHTYSTHSSIF